MWRSNQLSYRTVTACRKGRLGWVTQDRRQEAGKNNRKPKRHKHHCIALHCTCCVVPKSPTWKTKQQHSGSRKEVFQPHLPVRLPCYDLAPVNSFTLGRSLRVQTSGTTIFHGLTGGVYKARERIHRVMADARLLANPTSRSRVPDSDPN